jgi:glycine/D-amino acid oxidase-like deaminating enzyme
LSGRWPGYWATTVEQRPPEPLLGDARADVVVVGGGYTGLWTALELVERDPSLAVVLCEAEAVGFGASGRNGGFCEPSLTHGLANGVRHFPEEIHDLERLAAESFAGLRGFLAEHDVDCDFELNGVLDVAVAGWQVAELREAADLYAEHGQHADLLDAEQVRAEVDSPRFLAGLQRADAAILNPAKLACELARVARDRGITICEHSPILDLRAEGTGVVAEGAAGTVRADRAVLATNAYSGEVLGRTRRYYVPVYDYVLVSEPLDADQRAAIGWERRQGLADGGNQFHYFRLTADDRILWGGYDAVYHYGNRVGAGLDARPATFARLEEHFRATFPQLGEVVFRHRWGGAIATTTRFTPVFGDALGGRATYALGYTGLGVAASRFAGRVLADKILAPDSPLLSLRYTSSRPFPFPPEPLRWAGVTAV